jgi:antitoxin VapB
MSASRKVSLFRNGANQAVRIPKEFELKGNEAIMRREGETLILEALARPTLLEVLARLSPIEEDFPNISDLPARPVDL